MEDIRAQVRLTAGVDGTSQIQTLVQTLAQTEARAKALREEAKRLRDGFAEMGNQGRLALQNIQANERIKQGFAGIGQASGQAATELNKLGRMGATSAGQIANAYRQLPAQLNDIGVSLAGGQSPLLVLLQQGTQITESFGGVGNTFRALGNVITPARLALGGLAAAVGAVAYGFIAGSREADNFNRAIALTGNRAGQTQGSVNAIVGNLGNVNSVGTNRDIAQGALASGAFGPASFGAAVEAMSRLQRISGESADKIVSDFATMSRGVVAWATEHNRQYAFLTGAELAYVMQLENSGQKQEAMRFVVEKLTDTLKERQPQIGLFEKAWRAVTDAVSDAMDALKSIGRDDTVEESMARIQKRVVALSEELKTASKPRQQGIQTELAALAEEYGKYYSRLSAERDKAEKAARDAAAKQDEQEELLSREQRATSIVATQGQIRVAAAERESGARIATYQREQTALEDQKRRGIISVQTYTEASIELAAKEANERLRLLDLQAQAERATAAESLKRAKTEAERDQINLQTTLALNKILTERQQVIDSLTATTQRLNIASKELTPSQQELARLDTEIAKYRFLADNIERYSDKLQSSRAVEVEARIRGGDLRNLAPDEQAQFRSKASELDTEIERTRIGQIALEYDKQTKAIETNTRSLAQSALQREVAAALQDLENKGVKEGTDVYTRLAERRIEALTAAKNAQQDFNIGLRQGLNEYLDTVQNNAQMAKDALTSAFRGAEDALVKFSQTGKLNFRDFANSIIADLIRIQVRQTIMKPLLGVLSSLIPGGGGSQSPAPIVDVSQPVANANGNAFDRSGVQGFADGGIVDSPTLFKFASGGSFRNGLMGEAGPEAILPLKRGTDGKLGVRSVGGGGDVSVNVVVNVESGETKTSASGDQERGNQIGTLIAGAVREQLIKEKRPGGLLAAA